MQDPEFLQSVLENLPGVDPNNEAIRNAMGSLASQNRTKPPEGKKDDEKKQRNKMCLDSQRTRANTTDERFPTGLRIEMNTEFIYDLKKKQQE